MARTLLVIALVARRSRLREAVLRSVAVIGVVWLALAPAPASACSPGCTLGIEPLGTDLAPAHLPANGAFVQIRVGAISDLTRQTVSVERTRAGVTTTFALTPSLTPMAIDDAQPGDHLVVTYTGLCTVTRSEVVTTVIEVTPVAPLPTRLGVLEVEASRAAAVAVWDNRGGCTSDLASTVAPYDLTLDPSVAPWADALILTSTLDGAAWNETPDARVAPHFVFARCAALLPSQTAYDTTPGEHRLRIDGALRGISAIVSSNEATFELTCLGGSSGCAAAPARPSGASWWLCVAAAALALVARRRRT